MATKNSTENKPMTEKNFTWRWLLWGVLGLVLVSVIAGWVGYTQGNVQRTQSAEAQKTLLLTEQYNLGLQDISDGHYDLARQRFEHILTQDPEFPGAADRLVEVLVVLNVTATPTPAPTPTVLLPTVTPDTRDQQSLFEAAQAHLAAKEWDQALAVLDILRKDYAEYQAVQVSGMYYIALRNQGITKIYQDGNLEGGIYSLDQAEQLGVLDAEAQGARNWARYYLIGASFWEIDWGQAAYYFGIVAPNAPNLRDSSGMTARQRHQIAALKYADLLLISKQWCDADAQYQTGLSYAPNPTVQPTANWASQKCANYTPPAPTKTPVPTKAP